MPVDPLYFVHISDTHIGKEKGFVIFDENSYAATEEIVDAICRLPVVPDFIMHTGDVVASSSEEAYRLAAALFSRLPSPLYFVAGNHDSVDQMNQFLPMGEKAVIHPDLHVMSYVFLCKSHRCIVLDGRMDDPEETRGFVSPGQLAFLREHLEQDEKPVVLFIHFPPHPHDALWIDRQMLLMNGTEFHAMLVKHRSRIRGVFNGHVHRGIQTFADGLLYSSVPSVVCQFTAWPGEESPSADHGHPPAFNFVTIINNRTVIKEYVVPRVR